MTTNKTKLKTLVVSTNARLGLLRNEPDPENGVRWDKNT